MGLFNVIDPVLDFALGPLARLSPLAGILIITFIISLAIVLIYKLVTDQQHMKTLREQIKKYQEEMKHLREDPQKMMKVQKKAMSVNTELMKHSLKPTLYTMIPIIIIFGWLGAHFSVMPIAPGQPFNMTLTAGSSDQGTADILVPQGITLLSPGNVTLADGVATWTLEGSAGTYEVYFDYAGQKIGKRVEISTEQGVYAKSVKAKQTIVDYIYSGREGFIPKSSPVRMISVSYETIHPLPFSIFGWKPGWLGTYIILSLIFSVALRKLLRVY